MKSDSGKERERKRQREDRLFEVERMQEISDVNGNKGKESRLSSGFR